MQLLAHPPAPIPTAAANSNNNTSTKRKNSQRVVVQDRHSAIGQAQISEIQRLSMELANCNSQNRIASTSNIDQTCSNRPRNNYSTQAGRNQTLRHIISTGEEYRQELMAAQDKRNLIQRESNNIQKQFNAMAREKDILFAEINNERSKTSILEQELFIAKDTLQKFRQRFDTEKSQMTKELKTLKTNNYNLEQLVKGLAAKANLLPFYQQKTAESETRANSMNQQIQQVKTELKYYQEKSSYFENNYTVLNDNFNNLYNLNFNTNNTLKEYQTANTNLQAARKTLEEECKRLGNRCLELADDKNRQIGQLNQHLSQQSERIKIQNQALQVVVSKNDRLAVSLQESQKIAKQLQAKNDLMRKQIDNKSKQLHSQLIINEQLLAKIKELEANYEKKQTFWKNSLANEILKMNNQSTTRLLSVSSELVKSEENAKNVTMNLERYQSELNSTKDKNIHLEAQLSQSKIDLQEKEKALIILQETLQQTKANEISLTNCISEYEKRLSTALVIQEQTNLANKLTIEEKSQKVKELQQSFKQQQAEHSNVAQKYSQLMVQITKSTQLISMLTSELQFSKELVQSYKQKLNEEDKKIEWLNEQNQLKQKIIAQYSSVTDQMREKISSDHQDIVNINHKNAYLSQQIAKIKQITLQNQGLLSSQGQLIQKQYKSIKKYEEQLHQKAALIEQLQKNKIELLKQQYMANQKLKQLNQQLLQKSELLSNTQTAFKQIINKLKMQKQAKIGSLSQQYNANIDVLKAQNKRLESFSQQMFNDFKFTVQALRAEITTLQLTNKQNRDQLDIKTAKIVEQGNINGKLKSQNNEKAKSIQLLSVQIKEMTRIVEQKTLLSLELQQKTVQLGKDHQKSIEQYTQSHINKSNVLLSQWNAEKQEMTQKISEGYTYLSSKKELQAQLSIILSQHQHLKIELEGQQIRNQNLTIQNQLMRKSLIQMQQSLMSRFQTEIATKSRLQQQQTSKLVRLIEQLTASKSSLLVEKDLLLKRIAQKEYDIANLLKENERLNQIIKRNIQISKSENQFLKKANLELQVELQRAVQTSQIENRTKNELSKSISSLQLRNDFLEGSMEKTNGQLESIHKILSELKEQRDLLIKKYVTLTNEIYKFNSKDINLNRELDSFAQYFSKVSALHTQINKHLFNMKQLSQQTRPSIRQSSRIVQG